MQLLQSFRNINIFPLKNRVVGLIALFFIYFLFIYFFMAARDFTLRESDASNSIIDFVFRVFCLDFFIKKIVSKSFFFFYWISHELFLASKYSSWGSSLANLLKYSSSICLLRISDETKSLISWSKTFWYFLV